MKPPPCPQCGQTMRLEVWRSGAFWACDDAPLCRATRHYTALEPEPSADLFALRLNAQASFTRLWAEADRLYHRIGEIHFVVARVRQTARKRAYAWLALQLGVESLHIGLMNADDCRRAITACRGTSDKAVREWHKSQTETTEAKR